LYCERVFATPSQKLQKPCQSLSTDGSPPIELSQQAVSSRGHGQVRSALNKNQIDQYSEAINYYGRRHRFLVLYSYPRDVRTSPNVRTLTSFTILSLIWVFLILLHIQCRPHSQRNISALRSPIERLQTRSKSPRPLSMIVQLASMRPLGNASTDPSQFHRKTL